MSELEFWKDIGNISEAILNYQKKNAEFNDRFINPWLRLGTMVERSDKPVDLTQAYQRAVEIDPGNPQNWFALAEVHFQSGDYEKARQAYQKSAELAPYNPTALGELAYTLSMLKRHEEAIPLYLASLELLTEDKEKILVLNRLGEAYRKVNDYEKAFLTFQQADDIEKGKPTATVSDGPVDDPAGDVTPTPTPVSLLDRVLPTTPTASAAEPIQEVDDLPLEENFEALDEWDELEVESAAPQDVIEDLDEPEDVPAQHIPLPSIEFLPSWLSEEAKKNLTTRNNAQPGKTNIPQWLVVDQSVETNDNFPDDPPAEIANAVEIPSNDLGHFQAMNAALESDNDDQDEYDEYLKSIIEPEDELSDHIDDLKGASAQTETREPLLDMESKSAQVWNEMGNMYMQTSQFDEAIKAYKNAMELERHYAWPYSNMALAYVQKGLFPSALLLYQRSIELFTNDRDKAITWNRLGNLYRRMNDYDNTIAAYRTADELDPGSAAQAVRSSFGLLGNAAMENIPAHAG